MDFERARNAMVDSQVRTSDVTERRLQHILRTLPREVFAPASQRALAYAEIEVPLGPPGRVMLRARDLAKLIDALDIQTGERACVIAAGTGYTAAVVAQMTGEPVVATEPDAGLADAAKAAFETCKIDAVSISVAAVTDAPKGGPFDVIVVDGGADTVPDAWMTALADNGRLGVIVMDGPVGRATVFRKSSDGVLGQRAVFDATTPVLPGLERRVGFTF
jgi:protein-L-isoaspartate(D-aspartate) O-methyltransferase